MAGFKGVQRTPKEDPRVRRNFNRLVKALLALLDRNGSLDHGSLSGLGDDDHPQYVLRSILTTNGDMFIRAAGVVARLGVGSATQILGVSAGLPAWQDQSYIDHGNLTGLGDDDHPQYALDTDLAAHLNDTSDAHDASAISNVPAGNISATDVQAALNELDTEKAATADAVMDGDAAGGVLGGTYPNPSFAVDMATQAELDAHTGDTSDAHDASAISVVPFGTIAATDVQAALEEIVAESSGGSYTDEEAQDAVGAMVDTTLVYVDATPLLTRAALTGDVTAAQGSNALSIADNAVGKDELGILSTKGDLLGFSTEPERVPVSATNGQVLAALASAGLGIAYKDVCDYHRYDVSGSPHTWTKPANCKHILFLGRGAGGGGGGGRGNATGNRSGGCGGGGGSLMWRLVDAADVGTTVTITVAAGGAGGAGGTSANGIAGGSASNNVLGFGGIFTAVPLGFGGGGGDQGTAGNRGGGTGAGTMANGTQPGGAALLGAIPQQTVATNEFAIAGSGASCQGIDNAGSCAEYGGGSGGGTNASTPIARVGGSSVFGGAAGGGGGGINTGGTAASGAAAGTSNSHASGGGAAGGTGVLGAPGTAGTTAQTTSFYGGSGGGGGAPHTSGGTGGAGGLGASGCGGGGGGASTGTGGAGGNGGDGIVWVFAF